jgi:hypothetical protein
MRFFGQPTALLCFIIRSFFMATDVERSLGANFWLIYRVAYKNMARGCMSPVLLGSFWNEFSERDEDIATPTETFKVLQTILDQMARGILP